MKKVGGGDTNIVGKDMADVLSQVAPSNIDETFDDAEKGPMFVEQDDPDPTMTLNDKSLYDERGFQPANAVQKKEGQGFVDSRDIKTQARPATSIDLENLDETKIMDMPEIKAASFEILSLLELKPKDKSVRFRWANYKNYVAGNLARYFALGFKVASIDDVDTDRTPVDPSMVDGSQVKYYDILLIKIPVIRLMELYKANILKSVNRLAKSKERGLREANRQFRDDVAASPGLSGVYNRTKEAIGGNEPVEFYTP
jgi:hypothetical protein